MIMQAPPGYPAWRKMRKALEINELTKTVRLLAFL